MTSLRLLAVLNVRSSTLPRAKRLAPRPDGLLTHLASPRSEKRRLAAGITGSGRTGVHRLGESLDAIDGEQRGVLGLVRESADGLLNLLLGDGECFGAGPALE